MNKFQRSYLYILYFMVVSVACNLFSPARVPVHPQSPVGAGSTTTHIISSVTPISVSLPTATSMIPITGHVLEPAADVPSPDKTVDDVESSGTGSEGRAPYGDSYQLNRFERPFLQNMTYVADMDIHRLSISHDQDWYYVSVQLIGNNPNNSLGIDYGAEIDLDGDGFGDYMIWANPPYASSWNTNTVRVFQDSNHDTAGISESRSDVVATGNGYDRLIFDGKSGQNADPDLAWVRMIEGDQALIQFAFKRSLTQSFFLIGAVSDAGLKDVSKYDYADSIREADAGSPVSGKEYFPLGSLYAVDNTCWIAYGSNTAGLKPKKMCQPIIQPASTAEPFCVHPPDCNGQDPGSGNYNPNTCTCG